VKVLLGGERRTRTGGAYSLWGARQNEKQEERISACAGGRKKNTEENIANGVSRGGEGRNCRGENYGYEVLRRVNKNKKLLPV